MLGEIFPSLNSASGTTQCWVKYIVWEPWVIFKYISLTFFLKMHLRKIRIDVYAETETKLLKE